MSQTDGSTVSARALTIISCVAFIPIGIATVLLGPMLPSLSARWSLNYSQAGALFTAEYIASTCAVALSGAIVSWKGFQFAIKCGLASSQSASRCSSPAHECWGSPALPSMEQGSGSPCPRPTCSLPK